MEPDPAGPAEFDEPERDIALLLIKYRKDVDALKEKCKSFTGPEHDDIFFLRYRLSYSDAAEAVEAIKFTVHWRAQPENQYLLSQVQAAEAGQKSATEEKGPMHGLSVSAYHKGLKDGGPMQILRPGAVDFSPVADIYSKETFVQFHMMQKEASWRVCDEMTRRTGRLVKLVVVNDFHNMKCMSMPPKKIMQSFSESSKLAEKLYPQLLQTTVCCNTPGWFAWLVKAAKVFMSKRTMEKFKVCPRTGKLEDCPFVRKYMIPEHMPSYLGGPCRCDHQGGCVAGVGNDVKTVRILTKDEVQMMKDFGIKREAEEKVKLAAWLEERQKEADAKKAKGNGPPPSVPSRPAPPSGAAPAPAATTAAAPSGASAPAPAPAPAADGAPVVAPEVSTPSGAPVAETTH